MQLNNIVYNTRLESNVLRRTDLQNIDGYGDRKNVLFCKSRRVNGYN